MTLLLSQRSSNETCFSTPSILKEDRPVPSRKLDLILTSPSFDLPPIFVGESHLRALWIVFVLAPLTTVFFSTGCITFCFRPKSATFPSLDLSTPFIAAYDTVTSLDARCLLLTCSFSAPFPLLSGGLDPAKLGGRLGTLTFDRPSASFNEAKTGFIEGKMADSFYFSSYRYYLILFAA